MLRDRGPVEFPIPPIPDSHGEGDDAKKPPTQAAQAAKSDAPTHRFGQAADHEKQDRFLKKVREKQDLVFDRDAIETLLLGSHKGRLPEVTDAAPPELFAALPILAKRMAIAAKVIRIYPSSSKVVKEALGALVKTLQKIHQLCQMFTLSHRGNDHPIEVFEPDWSETGNK